MLLLVPCLDTVVKAAEADDENAIATELHADTSGTLPTTQGAVMPTVCIEGEEFESASTEIWLVSVLPWVGIAILVVALIAGIATVLHHKKKG